MTKWIYSTYCCFIVVIAAIIYLFYSRGTIEMMFSLGLFAISCVVVAWIFYYNRNDKIMTDYLWNSRYLLFIVLIVCSVVTFVLFTVTGEKYLFINKVSTMSTIFIINAVIFFKYITANNKTFKAYLPFGVLLVVIYLFVTNLPTYTYQQAKDIIHRQNLNYELNNSHLNIIYGIDYDYYVVSLKNSEHSLEYIFDPYTGEIGHLSKADLE